MENKCEMCGMKAVTQVTDDKGIIHYYCEHHRPESKIHALSQIETTPKDYLLFTLILLFIATLSVVYEHLFTKPGLLELIRAFEGFFFIVFALFKLADLEGFAVSYANYDIVAKNFYKYGYLYPFIELSLGIAFLLNFQLLLVATLTAAIMTIGSIGVLKELLKGSKIKCACLGTYIKLPLTTVSLTEDAVMGVMALVMVLLR